VKATYTIADVLQVAPPASWNTTLHGRRSRGRVEWFLRSASSSRPDFPAAEAFTTARVANHLVAMERDGKSTASQNRTLSAIMSVWRRAHRLGLLEVAPPEGLYQREPKGRRRVLSPEEEPRLLAALAEPYRSLAAFLLASGLRVGEALALRWEDVEQDFQDLSKRVLVRDSKNGDARVVPGVRAFVPSPNRSWYGPGPFTRISHSAFDHAFRAAKATLGLAGDRELVPHSLRHTYATRLVVAGVPLSVVARLLGHRTVRTTMRYSHVSDEDAARWVRRVSGKSA